MKFIKYLCKLLLFVFCCAIFLPTYANDYKTTVTFASVNGSEVYDVEIMQLDDGCILLPIKQIADILEIEITTNHATKEFSFGDIKANKKAVSKSGVKLNKKQIIYLPQGMMDEVKDEIFCESEILSQIFDTEIKLNKNDLSIGIVTDKQIGLAKEEDKTHLPQKKLYKAYSDITRPVKKKKITLDTVEFNNSTFSDSATQIYKATRNSSVAFNNAGRFKFKGMAYGGEWEVNTTGNNYRDKLFAFSGMNFLYKKKCKDKFLEFGKISGVNDENNQFGQGVIGVQVSNYDNSKKQKSLQDLEGEVGKTSLVNLYINDEFKETISTYDGYYSLGEVYFDNNEIHKLELKELKEDGSETSILVRDFPKYQDKGFDMKEKEKRRTIFAGVSGYDDRLFAKNGYFYQANSKKYVLGANEKYAIKDDLISSTSVLYDKIYLEDKNSIWAENFYNNNSILSMGTYKNPNSLEGITVSNTMDFMKSEHLKLQSDFKMSLAKNISTNENLFGYSGELRSVYEKGDLRLLLGVYNQSPDFYQAGSRYGFISDRLGAKIAGNYAYKSWGVNGSYNKYFSNTMNNVAGGVINFDEINFNLRGRIKNFAQIKYQFNTRIGENNFGRLENSYQDINISKSFKNGLLLEGGENISSFSSEVLDKNTNFISDYSTMYLKAGYSLPKNKGRIDLGHDITEYSTENYSNKFNMFKFNYTFPEMKRFLISLGAGYKYLGMSKGFNYSASIGYRTKSGMVVSLMYRYDTDMGYMFDNIYMPTSQRHSINLVFNNIFALTPSGLKSVGQSDESKGFLEVVAYLDKNENGVYDKDDIGIEDVPIKISDHSWVYNTKKNGKTDFVSTRKGVYKVKIDEEKLPCNLEVCGNKKGRYEQKALVQAQKQTLVTFKMKSAVGNIKGNLKIVDDFGRTKSIKDFIVVINDKDGKEVAYSTVDKNGDYYFSGITSGNYVIKLDENFKKKYNLESFEDKGEILVKVPYEYKEMVNINNQNLIYKTW